MPPGGYHRSQPFWDTRFLEGYYTRFGSVEELVAEPDDAVAIFGAGEEVHLEFAAPDRPVSPGWTRIYVLETEGWCKDMDLTIRQAMEVGDAKGNPDEVLSRL